jgi:transcriptional regulator with XRE-family HTH domain
MRGRALTAGANELVGRIAGAVLAAIRAETGTTQDGFAERMHVGLSTVQAWESGRRPLIKASFQDLQRLNRQLRTDGAPVGLLHLLEQALLVDSIYIDMSATESRPHPLALLVPDRALTELLTWPITGEAPQQLRAARSKLHVPGGVRDAVAAELRRAADSSPRDERGAMMREVPRGQ